MSISEFQQRELTKNKVYEISKAMEVELPDDQVEKISDIVEHVVGEVVDNVMKTGSYQSAILAMLDYVTQSLIIISKVAGDVSDVVEMPGPKEEE